MAAYKVRRGGSGRVASEPRLAPFRRFNQDLISSRNTFQKPFHLAYDEYERVKDLQFIKDLFTSADQNGNGTLEYKEFARCMSHPATFRVFNERFGLQRHQTPVVFRAFDLDGSGSISLPEWFETCTFLMQVVKDGDVITNWRQKDMRALKDNWESWNIKYPRQQHRAIAPGSPQGAGSQDRPSGPSTPVTPKRAVAAAERSGSRMCLTAPAALGGRSPLLRHSSSALSAAEDVASPRNACAASAPGGMLDPHGAGGAAKAPGRGGAARGGMLQREPASSSGGQWREPVTPPYWLTRSQSAPQGAARPGGAPRRRSSSEAAPDVLSPRAMLGGTAAEELEDKRRLAASRQSRQRSSSVSLPRVP